MRINYLKLRPGLFRDYFAYIDDETYTIDALLMQEKIRVKFKSDMVHPDNKKFCISILSCWKKDSDIIEHTVLKKLDNALLIKHGDDYTKYLDKVHDILVRNGVVEC